MQPAILVTGAPRSGTTFIGKMLCVPTHMAYLDEPFNYQTGLSGIRQPLVYLDENTADKNEHYLGLVKELLAGRGRFRSPELPGRDDHPLKRAGRQLFHSRSDLRYRLDHLNPQRNRYLIKDPMACMATGFLHQSLGLQTVVIIRHPASNIASFKRLRWKYNLSDFTSQPELMQRYLNPILGDLDLESLSAMQAWAYFWLCVNTVLDAYLQQYPDIKAVTHEQLSRDPQQQFAELYSHCRLPYTERAKRKVTEHTNASNPASPSVGAAHALRRNSLENIHRWHKILEPNEVDEIRRITEPLASKYYSDADW